MAEKEVSPWVKRNNQAIQGVKSKGLLHSEASTVRNLLRDAAANKLLAAPDDAGYRAAEMVRYRVYKTDEGKETPFRGQVSLPKNGKQDVAVWLWIDNTDNYYLIDANGVPINQDTMHALDAELNEQELECIRDILKQTSNSLSADISQNQDWLRERRDEIKKRIIITVSWVAAIALVGGGVTWGIFAWGINPSREATAYAQAYDTQGHDLPGEGAPVTSYAFAEISPAEFDAIPELRRKDTSLDSPRRVSVAYEDGCATVRIRDMQDGARLRAAMAENSSTFVANGYMLIVNDSSLDVCIANYKKPSSSSDMPKIAIQAVTDQE